MAMERKRKTKLTQINVIHIAGVDRPANRREFLIVKSEKEGGSMKDLMIEQIKMRARLYHGGDFDKAAVEYFRDNPEWYQELRDESHGVSKRDKEERDAVNAEVQFQMEMIAYRDKLDLDKPADRAAAAAKVCTENRDLYERCKAANTVRVGSR
jgi:hypothetical protein